MSEEQRTVLTNSAYIDCVYVTTQQGRHTVIFLSHNDSLIYIVSMLCLL